MFDGNDLPHELLLTTRQKTKLRNEFNNNMSTYLKLSRAQLFKVIQPGGLLGLLLRKLAGPLRKAAVPLLKNILAPLGITAATSAIDSGIQKKIHGLGTTTLIISNDEMKNMMKTSQALGNSKILLKGITRTNKNETIEQKGGFLSMLLGSLGASLLESMLVEKGIVRASSGNEEGKGIVRTGYGKELGF